jgi:hypothetical protein
LRIESGVGGMALLPTSGATIASPLRGKEELERVLCALHVGRKFNATAVQEIHTKLGVIIGEWMSEQERREISPVAKALLSTAKNLSEVSRLLSGRETGLRSSVEFFVTTQAVNYLALDPTVGSPGEAQALVSAFQRDAVRLAHVCMVAYAGLPDQSGDRRPALGWYDDFTALLLEIAEKAGVNPTVGKDRQTKDRTGWLFEAAQALEPFLYREMRSPGPEACGKRLERSRRRLRGVKRQNPRRR